MKTCMIVVAVVLFYAGCSDNSKVSKKECLEQGLIYKVQKQLNFRTGKYETRSICIERKKRA